MGISKKTTLLTCLMIGLSGCHANEYNYDFYLSPKEQARMREKPVWTLKVNVDSNLGWVIGKRYKLTVTDGQVTLGIDPVPENGDIPKLFDVAGNELTDYEYSNKGVSYTPVGKGKLFKEVFFTFIRSSSKG